MSDNEHALARYDFPLKNADFSERCVVDTEQSIWVDTDAPGVTIKLIESAELIEPRLSILIRFAPGSTYDLSPYHGGEEFLVLEGALIDERGVHQQGTYVRNPTGTPHIPHSETGCLVFAKLGEFGVADMEHRVINSIDENAWLPGPTEGTRVIPLHMHDTRSVLMIRWDVATTFKPGLDPQGEEIFVVEGALEDDAGTYYRHTWIRNPISTWQAWKGHAGTIAYYKNGHFPVQQV